MYAQRCSALIDTWNVACCRHMLAVALVAQLYPDTWKEKLVRELPKAHSPPDKLLFAVRGVGDPDLFALLNDLLRKQEARRLEPRCVLCDRVTPDRYLYKVASPLG